MVAARAHFPQAYSRRISRVGGTAGTSEHQRIAQFDVDERYNIKYSLRVGS
jgi:hypothetical protein